MSYDNLLIDSCNIWRWSNGGTDAHNQPIKDWDEHYLEDESCRLVPSTGREVRIGNDIYVSDYTLFVGDIDITEKDKVFINSQEYDVLSVLDRKDSNKSHHKECLLRMVKQ